MAFGTSGVKTEYVILELDCLDVQKQRRLVRLLIGAFGIGKVLTDEKYPESSGEEWPTPPWPPPDGRSAKESKGS